MTETLEKDIGKFVILQSLTSWQRRCFFKCPLLSSSPESEAAFSRFVFLLLFLNEKLLFLVSSSFDFSMVPCQTLPRDKESARARDRDRNSHFIAWHVCMVGQTDFVTTSKGLDEAGDFFTTPRTPAAAHCIRWLPGVSTTARGPPNTRRDQ